MPQELKTIAERLETDFEASSEDEVLEELANKTYYRSSRVRMFYSKLGGSHKTPVPFIELRVWVISENPYEDWQEELKEQLDYLEKFYFTSIQHAIDAGEAMRVDLEEHQSLDPKFEARLRTMVHENVANVEGTVLNELLEDQYDISMTIQGREKAVEIDGDEALISFYRTGLPSDKWYLDRIYRYGCKFDRDGQIQYEYVESKDQFPYIHHLTELPPVDEQWEERVKPLIVGHEKLQSVAQRQYEEVMGREWETGYHAQLYDDWHGERRVVVRDAQGRFVPKGQFKPEQLEIYKKMKEKEEEMREDWEPFER